MKKFFYLLSLCLCMFVGGVTLSSCGDDTDDIIDDLENGNIKATAKLTIGENKDVLVVTYKGAYSETHTALFNDADKCTSYIVVYDFESSKLCDEMWKECKDEEEYTRNGSKKITADHSDEFAGYPKSAVDQVFKSMKQQIDNGDWD